MAVPQRTGEEKPRIQKINPPKIPWIDGNDNPSIDGGIDHLFKSKEEEISLLGRDGENLFQTFEKPIAIFEEIVEGEEGEEEPNHKGGEAF